MKEHRGSAGTRARKTVTSKLPPGLAVQKAPWRGVTALWAGRVTRPGKGVILTTNPMKKSCPAFTLGGVACLISVAAYAATPRPPATSAGRAETPR